MTVTAASPLSEIYEFFVQQGFGVIVHQEPPPKPAHKQLRKEPEVIREFWEATLPTHWVDLESITTFDPVARWYGSGDSNDAAVRRAFARWQSEPDGIPTDTPQIP